MNARSIGRAAAAAASLLLLALPAAAQAGADDSPRTGNPWDAVDRGDGATLGDRVSDGYCAANRRVDEQQLVHPITAPNISEDPFITTDVRGTVINHSFPRSQFLDGQGALILDVQGRLAVTDDLQIFVNRLGLADIHLPDSADHGITDLGVGFKYAILKDWNTHQHVSLGASFEFGISDEDRFYGDDEARLFATFARRLGEVNVSGSANLRLAVGDEDPRGDSDNLSLHLHADYPLHPNFSPVLELNYYDTLSNGGNVTPYSGVDLANFGGNEDEDVLSYGLGGEARLLDDVVVRAAYEAALTDNEDIFGDRWTLSAIWRF